MERLPTVPANEDLVLTNAQVHLIVDDLQGTAQSLDEVCLELFLVDSMGIASSPLDELDMFVFQCDRCNWWCEISEEAEQPDDCERVCDDCYNG